MIRAAQRSSSGTYTRLADFITPPATEQHKPHAQNTRIEPRLTLPTHQRSAENISWVKLWNTRTAETMAPPEDTPVPDQSNDFTYTTKLPSTYAQDIDTSPQKNEIGASGVPDKSADSHTGYHAEPVSLQENNKTEKTLNKPGFWQLDWFTQPFKRKNVISACAIPSIAQQEALQERELKQELVAIN